MKKTNYMTMAKAIGIILVVVGHSGAPKALVQFIYLFHMPLFFFISGYFYNDKYSVDPVTLIKKRLNSLYKPFLIYEVIFLLLHNLFFKFNLYSTTVMYGNKFIQAYSGGQFIKEFIKIVLFAGREPIVGVFWFFTSLFFVNVIFCCFSYLIEKMFSKNKEYTRAFCIIAIFIMANLATKYGFNISRFNNSLSMVLVYYLGYLFKRHEKDFEMCNIYFVGISLLLLSTSCIYGSVDVGLNSYLSPDFLIINSILGIYLILSLSKYIVKKDVLQSKLLYYIGNNTIVIMALQFLSFKLVILLQIKINSLPIESLAKFPVLNGANGWWILYTIVGVFVPIGIKYIFDSLNGKINIIKLNSNTTQY
ncbi:acyltransferase family protein [Clostridium estertheticum]|uniref:acyltransferase family protein n=1 Tax=Clostridium estertheticum TaxID=238834 RepID=UPI001C6F4EE3|nr:acyltransferase family protein [Clostridium estertheticum]MBW9154280.1 acyltransferase family protein [Clostridium estertheticum]WLC86706.1 acyltransferase family protein [Clostridium estertheticum]